MSTPRWQRVFSVFETALERAPDERRAFLDRTCDGDPALRRGVEELLEAHEEATFLDRPVVEQMAGAAREPSEAEVPPVDAIGPYRVLRRLGQGGMSTVYLAVRDDEAFRRRVVIKVVRSDMESEVMLRRLRAERQILASLEHPYIAHLYDGGNTVEGLPYFVMEYVEGVPIDAYCARNRLSVDGRLTLFRKVCAAVHYAHQNLVVHRDVKPSNILITADGDPKLLDFGIAKLLNAGLAASDLEPTAAWQRLLTPSYASPEQIRGQLVTTVSDVYSLGVLLYRLLTDRLPFELEGRSLGELERLLLETEPVKPSLAAITPEAGQDGARRPQDAAASALSRTLAGDVDAIVLKALRSTPQQRYASVESFAADVERFQRGLPVEARAGTWRYRAGKFVRRHRKGVALAAAVTALLIGFAAATTIQAKRVAFERDKKARVVSLILDVFRLSNPYVLPGAELTVREALERSPPLVEDALLEQPAVRAELLHTTGSILGVLGVHERAADQLTEALEIRTRLHGENHTEVAETMSALAAVRKDSLELEEAEKLARRAVQILRDRLGPGHPALVKPLIELVSVLCYQEEYGAAEPLAGEALALTHELPAGSEGEIAALEYLAQIHSARGEYDQAVALNRRALALSRGRFGDRYPGQIGTLSNLGLQLRRMGELDSAQQTYGEALELQREVFGEAHSDPILINNLAGTHYAAGDYAGAERLYREALAVVLDRWGEEHWTVLSLGLRIARTRTWQGAALEAEREIRRLMERRLVDDDHWLNDEALGALGESLSAQGRCDEAETALVGSFENILEKNRRERIRRDAFERLRDHFERCGKPQEVTRYETMLAAG